MDRIAPRHLGIIMDGNGRWAQKNGKKRQYGHRKGAMNVERIVEHAFLRGVSVVSLFAFSSENWSRPQEEVDAILNLIRDYFDRYLKRLVKNGVSVRVMGGCFRPAGRSAGIRRPGDGGDRRREKHSEYRHQLRRAAGARSARRKSSGGARPRHGRDARGRAGYGGAPRAGIFSSVRAAKSGFPTSCCTNPPMRNCILRTFTGRISTKGSWTARWRNFPPFPPLRTICRGLFMLKRTLTARAWSRVVVGFFSSATTWIRACFTF